MKMSILGCAFLVLNVVAVATASPVAPGSELRQLAEGFGFTEGPTADTEGNIYFSDQPNNRIHRWDTHGVLTTFLEPAGRANGLYWDHSGKLWACADEANELWRIDPLTRAHEVMVRGHEGKALNGPNDLWVHPSGGVYFTDPYFQRPYWKRGPSEQDGQHVYFLPIPNGPVRRVATNLVQPNGIVGSPDGKTLFVADPGRKKTFAYTITEDGSLTARREFCAQGSDGLTLDAEGNLYLTGSGGVTIFDPQGQRVATIPIPQPWTANVCFGGPDHRTLFITAGRALYAIDMRTQGAR
jgi:gluconolactonase